MYPPALTPTESRIFHRLLLKPASREELRPCLGDELSEPAVICMHISRLRRKLEGWYSIVSDQRVYTLARLGTAA